MFVPETAIDRIFKFVNPLLITDQLVPLFVDKNTPLLPVPAKMFVPETARELTHCPI